MQSGAELDRDTFRRLTWIAIVANGLGAVDVFVFLVFLLPVPYEPGDFGPPLWLMTILAALFVVTTLIAGTIWGRRQGRPIQRWLVSEEPAGELERDLVLRQPLRFIKISGTFWALGALFFTVLYSDAPASVIIANPVTILLGGVSCCALQYLLVERVTRPITARALASGPPTKPVVPGVTARLTMAWLLATGVPVLGAGAIAVIQLVDDDADTTTAAAAVLFLVGLGLGIGLLAILFAARSVADPIAAVRESLARVESGDFDARIAVDDGSEVGLLQAGFNRMAAGLGARERLRDLFGRHVGADVARAALDGEVTLGGEEREVAALFVDLVGSTTLASRRSATEVVGILNAFFAIVVEETERRGGFVNKFEGDAALCVFGAPIERPDAAGDALASARELRRRLSGEVEDVDFGIGVSAGLAVAGNVGAERRYEYTVIGDPVNEAARLCELAKARPERLLASEAAVRRAGKSEAGRWSVGEAITLRGRDAVTRLATAAA